MLTPSRVFLSLMLLLGGSAVTSQRAPTSTAAAPAVSFAQPSAYTIKSVTVNGVSVSTNSSVVDFTSYAKQFRKKYKDQVTAKAKEEIFRKNLQEIAALNAAVSGSKSGRRVPSSSTAGSRAGIAKKKSKKARFAQRSRAAAAASARTSAPATATSTTTTTTAAAPTSRASSGAAAAPKKSSGKSDKYRARFGPTRFTDMDPKLWKQRYLTSASTDRIAQKLGEQQKKAKTKKPSGRAAASKSKSKSRAARFLQQRPPPPPPPPKNVAPTSGSAYTSSMAKQHGQGDDPSYVYTEEEIARYRAQAQVLPKAPQSKLNGMVDQLVDWSGLTPGIRSTKACSACWATAAADLVQAAHFRAKGNTIKQLSAQAIIDCTVSSYDWGCNGGSVMTAINSAVDFAVKNGDSLGSFYYESDYPYRYNDKTPLVGGRGTCLATKGSALFNKRIPLVASWSWSLYPVRSPAVDALGLTKYFQAANQQAQIQSQVAMQRAGNSQAVSDAIMAVLAPTSAVSQEVDKAVANTKAALAERDAGLAANDQASRAVETAQREAERVWRECVAASCPTVKDLYDKNQKLKKDYEAKLAFEIAQRDVFSALVQKALDRQTAAFKARDDAVEAAKASAAASLKPVTDNVWDVAATMDAFSGYISKSHGYVQGPPENFLNQFLMGNAAYFVAREKQLAQLLNSQGPLAVIIDASRLQHYVGGILDDSCGCSNDPNAGNHALVLTGLQATPDGKQYWVLKNNWGIEWGNQGYLWLARGTNLCGLTNGVARVNMGGDASDPVSAISSKAIADFVAGKPSTYQPRE